MLQTLKRYVKSPEQQSRIDSLCLLLERKELLLDTVMDTFGRLRKTGEIVNSKIPAIVSHIQQADVLPAEKKEGGGNSEEGFLVIHQAREEKIGLSAAEGTAGTPATVHW